MEEKNDFEKLLISYLLNELNAADEAYVVKAINEDPIVKKDFEELKNLLQLFQIKQNIATINLTEERRHLEQRWKAKQEALAVTAETEPGKKTRTSLRWYVRTAVAAASVIIIATAAWWVLHTSSVKEPAVVINKKNVEEDTDKVSTRFETNVSGRPRRFFLPDSTEVILWDQSIVSFTAPFSGNKRDVSLRGKASFKVAKDKTKPFTVFSDGISTTALGTEFSVTSFTRENIITVRLEEGKVVVRSIDSIKGNFSNPFYLLPGQELVYNKQKLSAVVRKFKMGAGRNNDIAGGQILEEDPSLPKNNGGTWFMFNNQSLSQIFDQLGLIYNVDIVYSKKEVEKLYFIGKFDKKDSVEYILKSIASLNNLTLSKQKTKYIIRK